MRAKGGFQPQPQAAAGQQPERFAPRAGEGHVVQPAGPGPTSPPGQVRVLDEVTDGQYWGNLFVGACWREWAYLKWRENLQFRSYLTYQFSRCI